MITKMSAASSRLSSICSCETGTLLFAILNLILSTIGFLRGFCVLMYCYVNWIRVPLPDFVNLAGGTESSLLLLVFAAFLLHGILKKRSEYLKAYLVLGAILLSLSGIAIFVLICLGAGFWPLFAVILLGQVVYTLILAMIYNAYRKIKAANDTAEHNNEVTIQPPTTGLNRFAFRSSETWTMAFASVNLIFAVIGVLGGFAGFAQCYWNDYCYQTPTLLLWSEISLFVMVFAAFLFHGVLKKHPGHIKVYLVMGVALLILSNVVYLPLVPSDIIVYYDPEYTMIPELSGFLALFVIMQVVYAPILATIYHTYKKIRATQKDQNEHKLFLTENMEEHLSAPVHKLLQ